MLCLVSLCRRGWLPSSPLAAGRSWSCSLRGCRRRCAAPPPAAWLPSCWSRRCPLWGRRPACCATRWLGQTLRCVTFVCLWACCWWRGAAGRGKEVQEAVWQGEGQPCARSLQGGLRKAPARRAQHPPAPRAHAACQYPALPGCLMYCLIVPSVLHRLQYTAQVLLAPLVEALERELPAAAAGGARLSKVCRDWLFISAHVMPPSLCITMYREPSAVLGPRLGASADGSSTSAVPWLGPADCLARSRGRRRRLRCPSARRRLPVQLLPCI